MSTILALGCRTGGPAHPTRPLSLEAHLCEPVYRVDGDRLQGIDDDIAFLEVRMDHAQALDRHSVLDLAATCKEIGDADEDPSRLHRIPHIAAVDAARLEERLALTRGE